MSPNGRLRLDALARFVQDVSNDDTTDAGLDDDMAWVVRRTVVEVHAEAVLREELAMSTFCGGIGSRWAERRVSARGDGGAHIETATLWVHLDMDTGRPLKLPAQFHELYAEAAAGRTIRARLRHDDPPPQSPGGPAPAPWPLRFTDFDVLGHVNNAACWQIVEEALSKHRDLRAPLRAEVQHRTAIERDAAVMVATGSIDDGLGVWVSADDAVAVTATVLRR